MRWEATGKPPFRRHDLMHEHPSAWLLCYMENGLQKGWELGDKATGQPEMLVASKGQKQLPPGSGRRWRRLGDEEIKGKEGTRNNPMFMDT